MKPVQVVYERVTRREVEMATCRAALCNACHSGSIILKKLAPTFIVLTCLIAGCAASIPVNGRMERSDETFQGAIAGSGYRAGTGELVLVSSRKTTCRGSFTNISRRRGEGVLNCEDGRTGSFHLAGSGGVGSGTGELAGQRFTFTFDDRD